ncbi:hypothetical protein L798_08174 [Zootermopsis nevadensis]|uniref:Uncharacterized protein n=2 Tax=Zootermopsis nevadensis TaxID=136037 RepID=A0A067R6K5_ZOONE|nr:hypothetical protein L798_08174 [Zootermopsis nevadensis]
MISGTSGDVYWNRPLEPGLLYDLTLVALNWQDGEYESSFAKLKHPDQALSEKEGGIGAEWSALLLLLIIPVAVYFVIRKPKQTEPFELIYEDAVPERQVPEPDRTPDYHAADYPYEVVV